MANTDLQTVGGRIRWLVEQKLRTTHSAFADRIDVKRQQLSRWVNDPESPPNEESLTKIAQAGGVSVAWLRYGGELGVAVHETRAVYSDMESADEVAGRAILANPEFIRRLLGRFERKDVRSRLAVVNHYAEEYIGHGQAIPHWLEEIRRQILDDATGATEGSS